MRSRTLMPVVVVVALAMAVALWVAPGRLVAQGQTGAANTPNARSGGTANAKLVWDPTAPPPANWTPPRTLWGDPDLRGYYLDSSYTPVERPVALKGKALYTVEEAVQAFQKQIGLAAEFDTTVIHYDTKEYGQQLWQSPIRPNRRTSLVVDPPDGRIPPLTPEAQKRQAARAAAEKAKGIDVRSLPVFTRCITGENGIPKTHGALNREYQIFQSPGYVALFIQHIGEERIIPLDGRPHLPSNITTWLGDSRGRFEGNTLIVETTNFSDQRQWRGSGGGLHLVERFTLTDAKTLKYEFTVSDPTTWARPWSYEAPNWKIEPPLYEFACNEHNYGAINVAVGLQIREKEGIGPRGRAEVYSEER